MKAGLINQDFYFITKDFLTALFTAGGLVIAARGLATWKKQIKGSKEFDTAHSLHFAILKLREAIKHVRNPAIWSSESQKARKYIEEKHKADGETINNEDFVVYAMRWEKVTDAYVEVESHLLAAEALWGCEIVNLTKRLDKSVRELNIKINQLLGDPEARTESMSGIRDTVYDKSSQTEQDDFSLEISKSIDAVVDYLRGKIK